jgi:hypothetical protein
LIGDDALLLERLSALVEEIDPMPACVIAAARANFTPAVVKVTRRPGEDDANGACGITAQRSGSSAV